MNHSAVLRALMAAADKIGALQPVMAIMPWSELALTEDELLAWFEGDDVSAPSLSSPLFPSVSDEIAVNVPETHWEPEK